MKPNHNYSFTRFNSLYCLLFLFFLGFSSLYYSKKKLQQINVSDLFPNRLTLSDKVKKTTVLSITCLICSLVGSFKYSTANTT